MIENFKGFHKNTDKSIEEADRKQAGKLTFHQQARERLIKWYQSLDKSKQDSLKNAVAYVVESEYALSDRFQSLQNKLFEIREHTFGLRIYVFFESKIAYAIGAGNKSSQEEDIKQARRFINDFGK